MTPTTVPHDVNVTLTFIIHAGEIFSDSLDIVQRWTRIREIRCWRLETAYFNLESYFHFFLPFAPLSDTASRCDTLRRECFGVQRQKKQCPHEHLIAVYSLFPNPRSRMTTWDFSHEGHTTYERISMTAISSALDEPNLTPNLGWRKKNRPTNSLACVFLNCLVFKHSENCKCQEQEKWRLRKIPGTCFALRMFHVKRCTCNVSGRFLPDSLWKR